MKEEMKNKLMNVVRNIIAFNFWSLLIGAIIAVEAGTFLAIAIFAVCAFGYVKLANWTFKETAK